MANIRQVDAICHVVRCFEDDNITHVSGKVDPLDDVETINLELIFADLESIEKRYTRISKIARTKDKDAVRELAISWRKSKKRLWKKANPRAQSNSHLKKNRCT